MVVDDEKHLRHVLELVLSSRFRVICVEDGEKALEVARDMHPDVALVDIALPGISGFELPGRFKRISPSTKTIIISGVWKGIENAVKALKAGAENFIEKPFDEDQILDAVEEALKARREDAHGAVAGGTPARSDNTAPVIIGQNPHFRDCIDTAIEIAGTSLGVLVEGETGTGKELFARLIHYYSPHFAGGFIDVNCSHLSGDMGRDELFGHEKGAFTGADSRFEGAFERSIGGTLFLDEIGDLPYIVQPVLLRVLQEKEFLRVGGKEKIPWGGRVICATNQDIDVMRRKNRFRQDLFHRIACERIRIPPLRDRIDDIPLLAHAFLLEFGKAGTSFGPGVVEAFSAYPWPGNVRELKNEVERLAKTRTGQIPLGAVRKEIRGYNSKAGLKTSKRSLRHLSDEQKKALILKTLSETKGNRRAAARRLGIDYSYFRRLCKKLRIEC